MRTHARDSIVMDQMNQDEKMAANQSSRDRVRDQSYIKQYNIQTVLALLKKCQPISRTEIAHISCMSPTSITRIVTALLNQGLIYETTGDPRTGRGRKATHLRVHANGLYAVGIYLEKSLVRLCVTDFADKALYKVETLVDGECTPERMAQTAKELFDRMPEGIVEDISRIRAVGICLGGSVNIRNGMVKRSQQLGWQNENICKIFSEVFGMTACVENDVKACLIGEKVRMKISDEIDTVYLMAGATAGMAATSGGILVRGEENEAGSLNGIPVGRCADGSVDYLGNHITEDWIIRRAQRFDPSIHSLDALLCAHQQGQAWAVQIVEDIKTYLCLTTAMINGIFNPTRIILGGSLFTKFSAQLEDLIRKNALCIGGAYEESAMIGAAFIAMRTAVVQAIGQSIE